MFQTFKSKSVALCPKALNEHSSTLNSMFFTWEADHAKFGNIMSTCTSLLILNIFTFYMNLITVNTFFFKIKVCLHVTIFSPCPLLPPLKFSIVQMMMVRIMDRMDDGPFSFCYSNDNKKNIFNNGGNNGNWLKKLRREGLDLHRLLALVHNSCCYATMQHLMTSFCNIWWHHFEWLTHFGFWINR